MKKIVRQLAIAKAVGIDVSSVNKILNGVVGAKFRLETIERVFKAARRLGYDFSRVTKLQLGLALRDVLGRHSHEACGGCLQEHELLLRIQDKLPKPVPPAAASKEIAS